MKNQQTSDLYTETDRDCKNSSANCNSSKNCGGKKGIQRCGGLYS